MRRIVRDAGRPNPAVLAAPWRGIRLGSSNEPRDIIDLLEDEPGDDKGADSHAIAWVVLIVDDDHSVHQTTLLALRDAKIAGRPLQFLHAYSAAEARQSLMSNADIAVVLLDVVMETDNAGLQLVPAIRELGRRDLKIIVRTGQPGYASESYVTENFDVDGYLTKAKLTRSMLLDAIGSALGKRDGADSRQ